MHVRCAHTNYPTQGRCILIFVLSLFTTTSPNIPCPIVGNILVFHGRRALALQDVSRLNRPALLCGVCSSCVCVRLPFLPSNTVQAHRFACQSSNPLTLSLATVLCSILSRDASTVLFGKGQVGSRPTASQQHHARSHSHQPHIFVFGSLNQVVKIYRLISRVIFLWTHSPVAAKLASHACQTPSCPAETEETLTNKERKDPRSRRIVVSCACFSRATLYRLVIQFKNDHTT